MDYRINLLSFVENGDIIGAMALLKSLGVSKNYICKRADVDVTGFYRYERGLTQDYGEDKKEKLLEAIRFIYL